jgi:aminopeptidase N
MRNDNVVVCRRGDYTPPAYLVDRIALDFDLDPLQTTVVATLAVRRAGDARVPQPPLWLDGEDLELVELAVDGDAPDPGRIRVRPNGIELADLPPQCTLRIVNRIRPAGNTELMGLYQSSGCLFTQCEAEGFRRITYFPDRPDVMARYRVTLRADRDRFPVLLANGNLVSERDLPGGRHEAVWDDPTAKPSYLFALVAGRFVARQDSWRRASGRDALLQIWVEPGDLDKTEHAMACLKRAIAWDEQRYGLELDLDRFMIVASSDFNGGAMENKGLNIFNAKYVLASPAVATDVDYGHIESIVGHEYFHNWTGNRVTCRDWFQLSLKEGLTVFRDQQFSADQGGDASGRAVRRIADVRTLRATQFPEDAGPMAHPVRPDTYQEISNFYTATVYEKGAEVVRMLHTLVGEAGFRRGMDLYFERHDGQAVTCDDFVTAIGDASGRDFSQFRRWYAQAGTPRITARGIYDAAARSYELTLSQSTPATPGQPVKEPLHVPVAVGLLGADGRELALQLEGESHAGPTTRTLELQQPSQRFRFINLAERPVPSLLRGYSAPVLLDDGCSDDELAFLARHDADPFNRWEAVQRLATTQLLRLTDAFEHRETLALDDELVDCLRAILCDARLAPAFREQALTLPSEGVLGEQRACIDPQAIRSARRYALAELGRRLAAEWQAAYEGNRVDGAYTPAPGPAGRRALRNLALAYLAEGGRAGEELALRQLAGADNMTDRQAALAIIVNSRNPARAGILDRLAREWRHEPLLMIKWYQLQATAVAQADEPPVLERVRALMTHPGFSLANPNLVNALVRSFCVLNEAEFHRLDAPGYGYWSEQVLALDTINPTIAARIARALERWRRYTPDRREAMRHALERVAAAPQLSRDVREIITKSLEP